MLVDLMKENDIDVNWIFTQAKFHGKEGLFFFESVVKDSEEEGSDEQEHFFDAKCLLIDGAKFVYGEDMEKEIEINTKNEEVLFTRVDGASVSIPKAGFADMPFKLIEYSVTLPKHEKPEDYVEIDKD